MHPDGMRAAPRPTGQAIIHFFGQDGTEYRFDEGFLSDDGVRVRTYTILPTTLAGELTWRWWDEGLVPRDRSLYAVHKWWFYHEPFNVLRYVDAGGGLIGTYSDLLTGFDRMRQGHYRVTDQILDLWLYPDGRVLELDWDEFDAAVASGQLEPADAARLRATMRRLRDEAARGVFPAAYLAP